ncbi:beta-CASP ribonuclease aCPSF1, partial [archaeon]|nr:beta-CASP ribonuclease aCPSF1 [archaeon]
MDLFEDIKKQISVTLTERKVNFTKVEAEGSEIAVYTTNPIEFFENKSIVGYLAETFKKRINVRTEKSALMDPVEANEILKKIIPKDAGVKNIFFDAVFSEVVIEADKPGVVIGKLGDVSKSIIRDTKWIPKILRAPTENSEILKKVRGYVLKNSLERKQFLKDI